MSFTFNGSANKDQLEAIDNVWQQISGEKGCHLYNRKFSVDYIYIS